MWRTDDHCIHGPSIEAVLGPLKVWSSTWPGALRLCLTDHDLLKKVFQYERRHRTVSGPLDGALKDSSLYRLQWQKTEALTNHSCLVVGTLRSTRTGIAVAFVMREEAA